MSSDPSDREILWRDYLLSADIYKHSMDITVKVSMFSYGITGAIVAFCFAQKPLGGAKLGLLLPVVMCLGLALVFGTSAPLAGRLRDENVALAKKLDRDSAISFKPLVGVLWVFTVLYLVTAVGLVVLLFVL
jgi:hypothetical protein